jgi:predicted nucleic acid-binding protein
MTEPLLLDASVWLAALDRDDRYHDAARALIAAAADGTATLAALDLTLYEIANVAVVRWHSPVDAERLAQLVFATCLGTLERIDAELLNVAADIASEHGITVYDAAYVATSRRRDWTLVSADLADLVSRGLAIPPDRAASTG